MKLIAQVTLTTPAGDIPPGGELEVKDKTEAESLIHRGFAKAAPVKEKAKADAEAQAKAEAEAAAAAEAEAALAAAQAEEAAKAKALATGQP